LFHMFRIYFAFVLLAIPLAVQATDGKPDDKHHEARQACHACHTERVPSLKMSGKCKACHANGKLSDVITPGFNDQPGRKLKEQPAQLLSGMSVPMYYAESRVGAEPNEMVRIPAGDFILGSDSRLEDEGPE
jgi:hypothetical protein